MYHIVSPTRPFPKAALPRDDCSRSLDRIISDRLHLPANAKVRPRLVRRSMKLADHISQWLTNRPLFDIAGTQTMLRQLEGLSGHALIQQVLSLNGGTTITAHGLDNIPKIGPVIIASTHPTGMFDFIAHAGALLARRPDLKVVANQETEVFLGTDMIIPVKINKTNRAESAQDVTRLMHDHLNTGGAILIFGSGRVPSETDGQLVEPAWRSGTTRVSQQCQVPVVTAAVNARNSPYYYRLRALAKRLSGDNVGAMVGSLRYSAELLEKLGGRFDVVYGPQHAPGTRASDLKTAAEHLIPGLYAR